MIAISSPAEGQHFKTTDDIVASGTGGPVANSSLQPLVSSQQRAAPIDRAPTDGPGGSWSIDLGHLGVGSYILSVTGTDTSIASVDFFVDGTGVL